MNQTQKSFFDGRSVWVIGASTGIGRALSLELDSLGCSVLASARNESALEELRSATAGRIETLVLDVAEEGAISSALDALVASGSVPDSVIFVAAFYEPTAIQNIEKDDLEQTLRVNLWAPIEICRLLMPAFYARKRGQVAIVASVAGYCGLPKGQPYGATKAGLINFAETLYLESAPKGVDIKLINPGFVETPLTDKNQFVMPDILTPGQAAKHIVQGLCGSSFEIHFPKRFTRKLKFLAALPYRIYFKLMGKL